LSDLYRADALLFHEFTAVFPDDAVSAKFTIQFRIRTEQTVFYTLLAVTIFVLLAVKNSIALWMKSTMMLGSHGG